jgi:hypothetical protein
LREQRRYRAEEPAEGTVLDTIQRSKEVQTSEQRRQQKLQYNCIFMKLWRYRVSGRYSIRYITEIQGTSCVPKEAAPMTNTNINAWMKDFFKQN